MSAFWYVFLWNASLCFAAGLGVGLTIRFFKQLMEKIS